jgi:hypothetical protein
MSPNPQCSAVSASSHGFGTLIALRGIASGCKFDLGPTCWRSRDEPAAVENAMNPLAASFGETLASPDARESVGPLALVLIGLGLAARFKRRTAGRG